jgi:hypothetical protein
MTEAAVRLIISLATFIALMSLLATAGIKFFARSLRFGQALIISVFSFTISTLLIAVYFYVKASIRVPSSVGKHSGRPWPERPRLTSSPSGE